jgi:hypothetical protein
MSSYVSEGGRNTTLSVKNRYGACWSRKQMTCALFFYVKKVHLADDMRIWFFGIRFTTLMSCEHSINSFPKRGSKRGRSVLHDFTLRSFIPFKTS